MSGSFESGMECMYAQSRSWIILSSERVFRGMESDRTHVPRGKIPSTAVGEWNSTFLYTEQVNILLLYS